MSVAVIAFRLSPRFPRHLRYSRETADPRETTAIVYRALQSTWGVVGSQQPRARAAISRELI